MKSRQAWRCFINHADRVLKEILEHGESGAGDIAEADLVWARQRIAAMVAAAQAGVLPPVDRRHAELTRMIMDQWPLGHPLGSRIAALEREYRNL